MHMHLVQFMAKSRTVIDRVNDYRGTDADRIMAEIEGRDSIAITMSQTETRALDPNEQGFKDTIRINPGEMLEVDAWFDGYMGRYVYHCHLLEHEDHDMMRQFIVTRDDVKHEGSPVSVGD